MLALHDERGDGPFIVLLIISRQPATVHDDKFVVAAGDVIIFL
jgi:hypothetical protein